MIVTPNGSLPSLHAPAEHFTGKVRLDPLFLQPKAPQRTTGAYVTFEPGARSDWHTHPVGQTLVITAGTGWVQEWGGVRHTVHPGDVIHCPPGVKHWHGASAENAMTHLALQENNAEGKNVNWMEKVSDEVYHQG
ncbi:MAG: cupin domain-containing protein [Erwinia sp.]